MTATRPVIGAGYPYSPHLAHRGASPRHQHVVQAHDGRRPTGPEPVSEPRPFPVGAGVQGGRPGESGPGPALGNVRAIQKPAVRIPKQPVVPAGVEVTGHYLRPWRTGQARTQQRQFALPLSCAPLERSLRMHHSEPH